MYQHIKNPGGLWLIAVKVKFLVTGLNPNICYPGYQQSCRFEATHPIIRPCTSWRNKKITTFETQVT